jgi:phenylacetate-CoA ligase
MNVSQLPTVLRHWLAAQWRWRRLDATRLATYQERRAQQIIAYAQRHSPFYRAHWHDHDRRAWRALPTVDKGAMVEHFDQFNTVGVTQATAQQVAAGAEQSRDFRPTLRTAQGQSVTAGLSSGTSGQRGLFLVTEAEIGAWAGVILARALHGLPWQGCRVAFFLRAFSNLYAGVNNPWLKLRYFDLSRPLDRAVTALNHFRPHLLVGPPSLLTALAAQKRAGALTITPQRLIAVAEVLEAHDEVQLQESFGVPVQQIYQCTEGLLAISCAQGRLHLQEDLVAVQLEPLPTQPGAAPRYTPIITDLWRTTQPIIRYRLGDILQVDPDPCPCGGPFRTLAAVEGRVADICYFTGLDGQRTPFYPALLSRLVRASLPPAMDYQLVQAGDGQLQIYLTPLPTLAHKPFAQQVQQAVGAAIGAYGCQPPQVTVAYGLPPRLPITKQRRVQRLTEQDRVGDSCTL